MGRPSKGFRIKPQSGSSVLAVAWTDPPKPGEKRGRPRQQTTGERDPVRAAKVGASIYSAAIRGLEPQRRKASRRPGDSLERLAEQWLIARKDLDPETRATYALYFETHLAPYFGTLASVHENSVREYSTQRLQCVSASTVRHELSCLRMLIRWACPNENADLLVPSLGKHVRGTSYETSSGKRRRGKPQELTEQEVLSIILALPEWSRTPKGRPKSERFPIRARFVVKYETGLREGLLDQLSVPEHWDPSNPSELRITRELDKMRYERVVPLTPRAIQALKSGVLGVGLVFGAHDYRAAVRAAALASGISPSRAKLLAPNDLRHARATHLGAKPEANLAGMMHMFGWTQPSTAARYMHPEKSAHEKMLASTAPNLPASSAPSWAEGPIEDDDESEFPDDGPFGFG